MLDSERDTYDGNAAEGSERQVEQGDLDASYKYPDHIHYDCKASAVIGTRHNFMTERPKSKRSDLDKLYSERNADDGDAGQKTDNPIIHGYKEST